MNSPKFEEQPLVAPAPVKKPTSPEKVPSIPLPNPFQPVKPIITPGTQPSPKA